MLNLQTFSQANKKGEVWMFEKKTDKKKDDDTFLYMVIGSVTALGLYNFYLSLSLMEAILIISTAIVGLALALIFLWDRFSKTSKERKKKVIKINEIPESLLCKNDSAILLGQEKDLGVQIHLPDSIRSRHVHVLGATGSGKTESIILNFLKQDIDRGLGAIILDAKGDYSFMKSLTKWVPEEKLKIFDLGSENSMTYNPLEVGTPHEAAQRLFSSLTWSEEYYKSKALSALQRIFEDEFAKKGKNPKLIDILQYLDNPDLFTAVLTSENYPKKLAEKDFGELSGLRDQIRSLCTGYLSKTLSPESKSDMQLDQASEGCVLYFRLQSLLSPQLVSTLGKLIINHLNYIAGTAHKNDNADKPKLIPTYLDEFASFACPEFADLISKARSAGMALHFSHQSIGDLVEVSKGFLNRITDNSATKIVMRINDPDSAEYFSRAFGTETVRKLTRKVKNTDDPDSAETMEMASMRETQQFRASPDLFKTLPTGMGAVIVAHGLESAQGASNVFKMKFPLLSS